jgi:acylphosphatase
MQRCEVIYRGNVQGVGFRYTTQRIAAGHVVSGFVRNLPDGTVQLVAEGEAEELDRFLADIDQAMGDYIRERQTRRSGATGEYQGFTTRR